MKKQLVKMAALIAVAAVAQVKANELALAMRGYEAMGGEVFVLPIILWAGYHLLGLARYVKEQEMDE